MNGILPFQAAIFACNCNLEMMDLLICSHDPGPVCISSSIKTVQDLAHIRPASYQEIENEINHIHMQSKMLL